MSPWPRLALADARGTDEEGANRQTISKPNASRQQETNRPQ